MSPAEDTPPSFDLAAPPTSEEGERMRRRVAARLFDQAEPRPESIAHYELGRRIGAGGMGVVYVARDLRLDRLVALKLMRRNRTSERSRLIAEARTLARLSHPHVVQVYEVGEYEGGVYVVMELIEGRDLHHWQRVARPRLAELLDAYHQAGLGLAAAHALGIVHFDFKATNLLRGEDGRVRVADFGLAEQVVVEETPPESTRETDSRSHVRVMGTLGYMAPEVARGDQADARADQFSYCATLWEACTGRLPFPPGVGASSSASPSGLLAPRWLQSILLRGLAEDPSARWPSMLALLTELRAKPRRRRRGLALGLGVVLLGGASLGLRSLLPAACEPGTLDQVWTAARRADLLASGSSAPYVVEQVDRFATRWRATHENACGRALELRASVHACLDRRARRLDRTLALVEHETLADEHLDELLELLGDPSTCEGDPQREPPAELAREVAGLRERIDAARVELAAGRASVIEPEARALVAATRDHGFAPVEAEARDLLGQVLQVEGRNEAAIVEHRAVARLAETSGEATLLFAARVHAARTAVDANEPALAREWLHDAETSLTLLGHPTELEIEWLFTRSLWLAAAGPQHDLEAAIADARQALLLVDPHDEPQRRRLMLRLANILSESQLDAEALPLYTELVDSYSRALGPRAHALGMTYYDLALCEAQLGRLDAAQGHLVEALAIERETVGDDSPRVGEIYLAMANLALDRDAPDRAWALVEHAWALHERATPELTATAAMALTGLGRYEHALRLYESPAGRALDEPGYAINRAWLRCRVAACQGIEQGSVLVELLDTELGGHVRAIFANRELVEGRPDAALEWIAEIVAGIEERGRVADDVEAEVAWLASRALQDSAPSRALGLEGMIRENLMVARLDRVR
ncbi:protein kinase domain-containing protein [Nannocystaceae bacterium ST9]